MDYLQYLKEFDNSPWIAVGVLNLVINGLPSILKENNVSQWKAYLGF